MLMGEYILPTFTIKCEAAPRPITLLRRAMGRISAPYSHVVLLSMPSREVSACDSVSLRGCVRASICQTD